MNSMKTDRMLYFYLSLLIIETVALFWFSFLPFVDLVDTGGLLRPGDFEHMLAYVVYGFLVSRVLGYYMRGLERWKVVLASVLIGSLVGGLCEGIQLFVPTRAGDVIDCLIDTMGSFAGALLSSRFKPNFLK